ncbi:hypothetical protein R1flu_028236 [Riccia fluitans]|uniref:Uncharacterized protein n=1 Tax=Riccia fluitans TaxID=41844 RepID=A0ABD1XLS2_9MARC
MKFISSFGTISSLASGIRVSEPWVETPSSLDCILDSDHQSISISYDLFFGVKAILFKLDFTGRIHFETPRPGTEPF